MAKGRKPIPNEVKKLRGTNQPVRMKNNLSVDKVSSIKMPRVLKTVRSKRIFKEKANQLLNIGILTELDLENLVLYANCLDIAFNCIPEINKGYIKEIYRIVEDEKVLTGVAINPHIKIFNDMMDRVNKIGGDYGFSPVSRMKLSTPQKEDSNDNDGFD